MAEAKQTGTGVAKPGVSRDNTGKKVLIIDDTSDVRLIIIETLNIFGFEPLAAEDGVSGIAVAKAELPDLIICDINMPNLDGYETLKAIRQNPSTAMIPFIFLSGAADKLNMRKGMELGADDYLTKPFTHKELLAAVNTRLEKQAERQRQSDRKLQELRGNITLALPHELRTPLNGIMGLADLLMEDYQNLPPEEVLESAKYIHESALRLHRLIENFLVFSQIELMASESKGIDLSPGLAPVEVDQVVPDVCLKVAERFERLEDLTVKTAPRSLAVPEENLRKIVEELVDNAFKFSESGRPVVVRGADTEQGYSITVADQGRGMTVEQIARIAPHLQFDRQIYEQQGAGLGLVIAKRMTEMLGGKFSIDSVPGEGTAMTVTFERRTLG